MLLEAFVCQHGSACDISMANCKLACVYDGYSAQSPAGAGLLDAIYTRFTYILLSQPCHADTAKSFVALCDTAHWNMQYLSSLHVLLYITASRSRLLNRTMHFIHMLHVRTQQQECFHTLGSLTRLW